MMKRILLMLAVSAALFSTQCVQAEETGPAQRICMPVTAGQVMFSEDGLFVMLADQLVAADAIIQAADGTYYGLVEAPNDDPSKNWGYTCPNGHAWVPAYGGCGVSSCPYYGSKLR